MSFTEQRKRLVEPFVRLTADELECWVSNFADGRQLFPELPKTSFEPITDLANLFHALPADATQRFKEAVDRVLECTTVPIGPGQTALVERLGTLIEIVNFAKPPRAKRMLSRLANVTLLEGLRHFGKDLHLSVLNAACAYDVDEEMTALLYRLATPDRDFEYLITVFRLISYSMSATVTYPILERLIPKLGDPADVEYLGRELPLIVERVGATGLLEFYQRYETGGARYSHLELIRAVLATELLPNLVSEANRLEASEPAAALLGLQIATEDLELRLDEIKRIGQMAGEVVPREVAVHLLAELHGRSLPSDPAQRMWDMLDHSRVRTPHSRPGTVRLYADDETLVLHRGKDDELIDVFADALSLYNKRTLSDDDLVKLAHPAKGDFVNMIGSLARAAEAR